MRIIFVRHSMFYPAPTLSHGMGIIATILHQAGHQVKVIDNNSLYTFYNDNYMMKIIKRYKPDVLALNINTATARITYDLIEKVRKKYPQMLIVAGGIHMKYCFEEALEHSIDVVVNREGEMVVIPLFKHLQGKTKEDFKTGLEAVPGISFIRDDSSLHISTEFPMIENLDNVPFVDYSLFNLSDYFKTKKEQGLMILNGQRGCPFKCTFCSNEEQVLDNRLASADYMFRNLVYCYENYGAKYFSIVDNNFLLAKKRVVDFCNKMIESGLNKKIMLVVQTKVETVNDGQLLSLLKKAGVHRMAIGLERLDPYSLKMIKKNADIKKVHRGFSLLQRYNIDVHINFLLGFPFETDDLLKREKQALRNILKYVQVTHLNIIQPMPGTMYYDKYPKINKWYLRKGFNDTMSTYYGQILELNTIDIIDHNYFELPQKAIEELKDFYIEFKALNHGNFIAKKNILISLMLMFDRFLANISKFVHKISPGLEFTIFRKLSFLRYYIGMMFVGNQLGKSSE